MGGVGPVHLPGELQGQAGRVLVDGDGVVNGLAFQAADPTALEDKAKVAAIKDYLKRMRQGPGVGRTATRTRGRRSGRRTPGCAPHVSVSAVDAPDREADVDRAGVIESEQEMADAFLKVGLITEGVRRRRRTSAAGFRRRPSARPEREARPMGISCTGSCRPGGDARRLVGGGHSVAQGVGRPATLGKVNGFRETDIEYLAPIAKTAEQLGFEGVLTPTGTSSKDAWLATAALDPRDTEPEVPRGLPARAHLRRRWPRRWRPPSRGTRTDDCCSTS